MKRTETFDASILSGTHNNYVNSNNHHNNTSKVSPKSERRASREITLPNRNSEVTTLHTLQLKAHTLSSSRALPGIVKVPQSRPVAT
ncbi:unnamed protein product, partial [Rotaria socialis]